MHRYLFEISYDGSGFYGWQKQPGKETIQETIENALSKIHSLKAMRIYGCGRTDTGVHAKEYFFHWDTEGQIEVENIKYKLNKMLPKKIAVHSIREVDHELHARYSAVRRTYKYFIDTGKDPFIAGKSWRIPQKLDLEAMNAASSFLLGKKDFSSFAKIHTDVKNHMCKVSYATWSIQEKEIIFEIRANRFLRNMVRAIVGTCIDVGLHKIDLIEFKEIIHAKDRQRGSGSAPAEGLFLWKVEYDFS